MVKLEEPDKGRAWVIAFASCIITMILSGLSRSVGILYVSIIETYGVSRAEATLPFTIRSGIRYLSGPLIGIIGQRYSIRNITFVGGIIAAAGVALCSIAPSTTWIAILWGGIHGFGVAMTNTLFQVTVNQYFNKHRATASGIALSGACLGNFVFPFIVEEILDTYALSGVFLILGGVIMHVLPPSLLLSSPQWIKYPGAYARLWSLQNAGKSVDTVHITVEEDFRDPTSVEDAHEIRLDRTTSLSNCPVDGVDVIQASRHHSNEKDTQVFRSAADILSEKSRPDIQRNVVSTLCRIREPSFEADKKTPLQNEQTESENITRILTLSAQVSAEKSNLAPGPPSPPFKEVSEKEVEAKSISESVKDIIRLCKNPTYLMISISFSSYTVISVSILTVMVDYGIDKGISSTYGKYLINAMAIGDLVGRLGLGWVTDRKYMTIPAFMILMFVLEGIFTALFPFAMTLSSFMILLILYGITSASILVLLPILVLQYVDMDMQSVGMACVGVVSGIMSFVIPPMIGHFRDVVGSYDGMFYLTGIISVLCGGLWLLEPVTLKWHKAICERRKLQSETSTTVTSQKEFINENQVKL